MMQLLQNAVTGLSSKRIIWVDVVRAVAILLIIGFHVAYEFTLDPGLRYIGYLGDSLFFIVSGYMLAQHYPRVLSFDINWLWKRYVKVASLYYPTLIIIAVLFFSSQGFFALAYDLLLHFTFLNWAVPGYMYTIISPAWFVLPLMAFYLAFPYLNKAIAWSKYLLIIAVLITIAVRFNEGSMASPNPLFFLADFCFGMVFARYGRDWVLLAPLATAVVSPVMAVSFIAFYLISLLEYVSLPALIGSAFTLIGSYTFELFLFHESVMKTALGKWNIFGLDVLPSLAVLGIALIAIDMISKKIQYVLLKEAGG